ncbi:MAG: peptidylprolyl isomerase [Planctomycetota bacterium]|nr:peptidylprolyl isomerase [Planctomycetota bacterium]
MKRECRAWNLAGVWLLVCAGCASTPKPTPAAAPAIPTTATAGATTIVALSPPTPACCPKQTLPQFLGVSGLLPGIGKGFTCLRSLLGMRFPGLEPKPSVLPITDPANANPNSPPAVKAAAEIKAEEDAAPQKIKAIRYLATIGCAGCYPGVEEGLLAALDDCTEAVRYEAVKALRETAAGSPCKLCKANACCSPKVRKKLDKIAYGTNERGCYKESSARVRRLARVAMNACGGPPPDTAPALPKEGPSQEPTAQPMKNASIAGQPSATETAAIGPRLLDALAILQSGAHGELGPKTEDTAVAAEVDGEPILIREIALSVAQRWASRRPGATLGGEQALQVSLIREELQRAVDRKLLCQDARRRLPAEELTQLVYQQADHDSVAAASATPPAGALAEPWNEERLADEWLRRQIDVPDTCSRQELFAHYRANFPKYQEATQFRWEQMSARFDRFASQEQAVAAIGYLRSSLLHEPSVPPQNVNLNALEVRTVASTDGEDLPGGVLAQALLTQPVGSVSPILRDVNGLHVVRVLQRIEPGVKPLEEVADAVRQGVLQERRELAMQTVLQGLRRRATIRTLPDEQLLSWPGRPPQSPPAVAPPAAGAPTPVACPCRG